MHRDLRIVTRRESADPCATVSRYIALGSKTIFCRTGAPESGLAGSELRVCAHEVADGGPIGAAGVRSAELHGLPIFVGLHGCRPAQRLHGQCRRRSEAGAKERAACAAIDVDRHFRVPPMLARSTIGLTLPRRA